MSPLACSLVPLTRLCNRGCVCVCVYVTRTFVLGELCSCCQGTRQTHKCVKCGCGEVCGPGSRVTALLANLGTHTHTHRHTHTHTRTHSELDTGESPVCMLCKYDAVLALLYFSLWYPILASSCIQSYSYLHLANLCVPMCAVCMYALTCMANSDTSCPSQLPSPLHHRPVLDGWR